MTFVAQGAVIDIEILRREDRLPLFRFSVYPNRQAVQSFPSRPTSR